MVIDLILLDELAFPDFLSVWLRNDNVSVCVIKV